MISELLKKKNLSKTFMGDVLAQLLGQVSKQRVAVHDTSGEERARKRARISAGGVDSSGNLRSTFVGGRHAYEFNMTPMSDFGGPTVPPPPFEKPSEIAVCSRDEHGVWTTDASAISKYSPPNCEGDYCDLKQGYERWQHEELGRAELTFEPVMQAIWDTAYPSRSGPPSVAPSAAAAATAKGPDRGPFPANIVMWRGQMSKLLCAPYSTREDWEMSAYIVDGIVYIEARETEACQRRKLDPTAQQRLSTYQGYKFESYCTDQPRDSSVNTKPGVAYNSVATTQIGELRLILAGEVDCYSAEPPAENYMELKTSKLFKRDDMRQRENFEKNKLLKYWAQSYTVGVPRVVVGFRTGDGIVKKVQRFYTTQVGARARARVNSTAPSYRAHAHARACARAHNFSHTLFSTHALTRDARAVPDSSDGGRPRAGDVGLSRLSRIRVSRHVVGASRAFGIRRRQGGSFEPYSEPRSRSLTNLAHSL